jgi:hypothetical protein
MKSEDSEEREERETYAWEKISVPEAVTFTTVLSQAINKD